MAKRVFFRFHYQDVIVLTLIQSTLAPIPLMVVGSVCYCEFLTEEMLMAEGKPKGPEFVRYFQPVIDVLKEKGGSATPKEVYEAIADQHDISEEDLSAQLKNGSSKFQNQVAWARFYLVKAGFVDASRKGVWSLTASGQRASLSHDEACKVQELPLNEVFLIDQGHSGNRHYQAGQSLFTPPGPAALRPRGTVEEWRRMGTSSGS